MKHNSHLTAITRKTLPVPTRWLMQQGLVTGRILDYGCGKCYTINPSHWHNYDPFHCPTTYWQWDNHYNTIICNYVLCTLPAEDRIVVLRNLQRLLASDGVAYVSVRNDRPKNGWGVSSRGTYQGRVRGLPLEMIRSVKPYRIYRLTKETKLV